MQIRLIAVGQKMPAWVEAGYQDYAARLKGNISLSLIEIPLHKRSDKNQIAAARQKEEGQMLDYVAQADYVVTLDMGGRQHSSEALAQRLETWQARARQLALLIGGPEGLSEAVKARADESWSLGALTLPHPLVRIVVAEALYRAWSINQHHPYHRG